MKIKEIIEMSTDELADEEARSAPGEFASALAAAERPARTAEPAAFAPSRRGPDRDGAHASATKAADEIIYGRSRQSTMADATADTQPTSCATARGSRKTRVGEVISSGMNKTIVVRTVTRVPHAEVRQDREADEEILRARRREQGEDRRHRAHHGNAAAEQIEALAAGGSRPEVE